MAHGVSLRQPREEAFLQEVDQYLTINEACKAFGFSRSTFYRMHDDPGTGLRDVVIRIPPGSGRIRIPRGGFETWLRQKRRGRRAGE
jgi:predicted DNA-binding transcriptional regulator AlpA